MNKNKILTILIIAVVLLIYICTLFLNSKYPITFIGLGGIINAILSLVVAICCLSGSYVLAKIVVQQEDKNHFINIPAIILSILFCFIGITRFLEFIGVWAEVVWFYMVFKFLLTIFLLAALVQIIKYREIISNVPDISGLQKAIKNLNERVDALKSTHPYYRDDPEDWDEVNKHIYTTLKDVTIFLDSFKGQQ